MKTIIFAAAFACFCLNGAASACGGFGQLPCTVTQPTVTAPRMPTYINPQVGGGYTVNTPGQMPTYVNPQIGGGYTINTPGQMPRFCNPQIGGGMVCN